MRNEELVLREKIAALERDLLEIETQNGIELDDIKLANLELRARARRLEGKFLHTEVFKEYEREIESVQMKLEKLRKNMTEIMVDILKDHMRRRPGIAGTIKVTMQELERVESQAAALRAEKYALELENRQSWIDQIRFQDTSSTLASLSKENQAIRQQLERESLRLAEVEAEAHLSSQNIERLEAKNSTLSAEQRQTSDEVYDLRAYAGAVMEERNREAILERFISKHASDRNPLYISNRAERDIETSNKAMRSIMESLEVVETVLQDKVTGTSNPPILLIAKLKIELEKMRSEVVKSLSAEEEISSALIDYVNDNTSRSK